MDVHAVPDSLIILTLPHQAESLDYMLVILRVPLPHAFDRFIRLLILLICIFAYGVLEIAQFVSMLPIA